MNNSPRETVDKMFASFREANVAGIVKTVSEDTIWIYHGTQKIPKGTFEKKAGVKAFFNNILEKTEMISFNTDQFITEGNTVVVIGSEHQKVKRSGREMKQKWVQIYTVEHNLITKMEEFATSEEMEK